MGSGKSHPCHLMGSSTANQKAPSATVTNRSGSVPRISKHRVGSIALELLKNGSNYIATMSLHYASIIEDVDVAENLVGADLGS